MKDLKIQPTIQICLEAWFLETFFFTFVVIFVNFITFPIISHSFVPTLSPENPALKKKNLIFL